MTLTREQRMIALGALGAVAGAGALLWWYQCRHLPDRAAGTDWTDTEQPATLGPTLQTLPPAPRTYPATLLECPGAVVRFLRGETSHAAT